MSKAAAPKGGIICAWCGKRAPSLLRGYCPKCEAQRVVDIQEATRREAMAHGLLTEDVQRENQRLRRGIQRALKAKGDKRTLLELLKRLLEQGRPKKVVVGL